MYSQERVAPIRSGSSTRFSSDSLPLFVAARISQKLLPVVGRELQVAGCGLGLSSVCGVFTFDASCKCAIFSLSLFILFLFSRMPCYIQHAAHSVLHSAGDQSPVGQPGKQAIHIIFLHWPTASECHRGSETETETVTETEMGRQSAQSGSSFLLLAFIDWVLYQKNETSKRISCQLQTWCRGSPGGKGRLPDAGQLADRVEGRGEGDARLHFHLHAVCLFAKVRVGVGVGVGVEVQCQCAP